MHLVDEDSGGPDAETSLACASCGAEAVRLRLFRAGGLREGVRVGEGAAGVLVASGFVGVVEMVVGAGAFAALREFLGRGDARRLHGLDPKYAPCFCRGCGKNYCAAHWRAEVVEDEGFYDCTYGTCPAGHRQMIDD